ncbi:hypothetical protein BJY24_005764 [Nocardia transvalensis]|uniref:Uncharacterized protein n=1 Tax=Nocardia transvalensis TaxID=37333 RepID=A0A7W9PIK9_9NOCA|nr:hypothetical protein [Nocardia transvalensis]MBB5916852.1 hypothetical protein [Nocardia transvalensis]
MSWPEQRYGLTDPEYYRDAADATERQLRADFAHHCLLMDAAVFAESPRQRSEFLNQAGALAVAWGRHRDERLRKMWQGSQTARAAYESRPMIAQARYSAVARARERGEPTVDDVTWRTLQQAREITGHAHSGPIAGSEQDAPHYHTRVTAPAPERAVSHSPGPDHRTAVQKALGAPRDMVRDSGEDMLDRVDAVLAATEDALAVEETEAALQARAQLLPRAVRDAPIAFNYGAGDDAIWTTRQTTVLRLLQDLTAEHTTVADGFTGDRAADQKLIRRLEKLQAAISATRLDAVHAGVSTDDVDHAYQLGRDGIHWSVEPASPRLGRIAQLTEHRDHARAEADALRTQIADLQRQLDHYTRGAGRDSPPPEHLATARPAPGPGIRAHGADIGDAVDAALPTAESGGWTPPPAPHESAHPAGVPVIEPESSPQPQL